MGVHFKDVNVAVVVAATKILAIFFFTLCIFLQHCETVFSQFSGPFCGNLSYRGGIGPRILLKLDR